MPRSSNLLSLCASLILAGASVAHATPFSFSQSYGDTLDASVTFQNSGTGNLVVTLTNTSTSDVLAPNQVLTGVFFDVAGNLALTRISAILGSGSSVFGGGVSPGNSVGGEWAYKNGLNVYDVNSGISSTGLGIFGAGDLFPPGTNLQNTATPGAVEYGITSAGDNTATANGGLSGQALIKNSVVFTLGGFKDLDPTLTISKVTFQYGTAIGEVKVPDSNSTALLFFLGMGLLVSPLVVRKMTRGRGSK